MAKATVDDLIALKMLRHRRMSERMQRSPAENLAFVKPFIEERGGTVDSFNDALKAVTHQAKGPKIKRPSHIFLVVGESYSQPYFDPAFTDLHIADEGKKLMKDVHTASIHTTLSGGIISRPSIVGLMLGIFDAGMELNEREPFGKGHCRRHCRYSCASWVMKRIIGTAAVYPTAISTTLRRPAGLIIPIPVPISAVPKRLDPGSASTTMFS